MRDFICPFCLKRHTKEQCLYRCNATRCPNDVQRDEFGYFDYSNLAICNKKCSESYEIICPSPETNKSQVIPPRALNQSVSIALLGGRNSGKSNYIAVLVNEIKKKMSSAFDCSLMPCDDTTDETYNNEFYKPLFKDSHPLKSTDSGRKKPLLFTIDFYKKSLFIKSMNNLLLPLYDTAGENMESLKTLNTNVNYIKNAGGIILLLDPFEIEEIAEQIKANVSGTEAPSKMEDILNRVQNILQEKKTNKIIETPIAIVLTKMDLVCDFTSLIPPDSILRQPSGHIQNGYFSQREFKAVDSAVRTLITSSNDTANNLFKKLEAFKNAAFFAVSSFGCDPSVADLKRQLKPNRVLDPLLWLLAINGYIKTGK